MLVFLLYVGGLLLGLILVLAVQIGNRSEKEMTNIFDEEMAQRGISSTESYHAEDLDVEKV